MRRSVAVCQAIAPELSVEYRARKPWADFDRSMTVCTGCVTICLRIALVCPIEVRKCQALFSGPPPRKLTKEMTKLCLPSNNDIHPCNRARTGLSGADAPSCKTRHSTTQHPARGRSGSGNSSSSWRGCQKVGSECLHGL